MKATIQTKAVLEGKTAGRVARSGLISAAKNTAKTTVLAVKSIIATLGVKTTIAIGATAIASGTYLFSPETLQTALSYIPRIPFLSSLAAMFGDASAVTRDFTANYRIDIQPNPTGLYRRLPEPVLEFFRFRSEDSMGNKIGYLDRKIANVPVILALFYGAGSLVKQGYNLYAKTTVYKESHLEVKKEGKHAKKVAQKLEEIQQSKVNGNPGLSHDADFMKAAIYLDLSLFNELDPQLLGSDQFLKDLAEGGTKAGLSEERKQALMKKILAKQQVLDHALVPAQTKRDFLESLGSSCPELLPFIVTNYSSSVQGDAVALGALLRLALPAGRAKKEEVVEAAKIQVATTKAILKVADSRIVNRAFLLDLGNISRAAMNQVLFPLLEDDEIIAHDHLNYMLARAEKDPRGTFNEAQFLQNTPAFMAVVCSSDPTMLSSCSNYLLKTPAFLADLLDRNPQAIKEVVKTPRFKEILLKNNRKIPKDLLKKILIFSHNAQFVDCIPAALPKMSNSLLISLTAKTPSLFKTRLLQNLGLSTKPAFVKAVLRKNPGALAEVPRSMKKKELFEELCSETRPFSNLYRLYQGKMLKHNKLIAEMAKDPETAFLVRPGGILSSKIDRHIANRAKRAVVSHKGSFESREKTYLDILEADPEFIQKIPPSSSEEEWENFVVKASTLNPMVIQHLSPAIVAKLEATSSNFVLAEFDGRIESAEEFLNRLGSNPATAHLLADKNFKAELAKKARIALRTVISEEEKLDAKYLRELDHKHKLGKGVYTYGAWSMDKRGGWYNPIRHMRATLPQLGDRIKATANEWIFNKFEHGPIDYMLRFRVEDYSNISPKKFDRFDTEV